MELAALTVLNQRYTVKRMLGEPGPFDITYLGQHVDSEEEFIIREYFPVHLARREEGKTSVEMQGEEEADLFDSGMEYFAKESKVLSELDHAALPESYDLFQSNGTSYRVRPHPSSMSLAKGLEDKGQLSEKSALTIMMPILEALQTAHDAGLYHGAVSPRTIRLLEGGNVLLTGFSGAYFQLARETGKMSVLVQSGTSPVEQYTPRGQQGPWTDVYSAAATICRMVTDQELPEATDRLEGTDTLEELIQDADVFSSPGVRETLVDALAVDPSQRLQSVEALISALTDASTKYEEGEEGEASYTIIPVESDEDEEEAVGDDEVEVLSASADRPARVSRDTEDEGTTVGQMALLVSIPILLIALGGGGAWYVMNSGGNSSGQNAAYQTIRARADSLFQTEEYERAEFFYNQALEFNRDDEYVQQRLARLAELQEQGSEQRYKRQLQRGDSLQNVADSLLAAGDLSKASNQYSKALGLYYSAQSIKPDENEVDERISSIQGRQEQIAKRQAQKAAAASQSRDTDEEESDGVSIEQLAQFFKKRGDRQLQAGNLQAAIDKYNRALEYKPNDQALREKVSELEERMKEQRGKQEFRRHYNEGRRLLREGKFAEAREAFKKAEKVMPNEPRLKQAMKTTEQMLKEQKASTKRYEQYRAAGDSLFEAGEYEEAISRYKNALSIRSDDDYVQKRIEQANEELEQMGLARQEMKEQASGKQADVYETVDQKPQVKGGMASLSREAKYPKAAKGAEGRVYVQTVVNADGSVRSAEVARGKNDALNQEALRVVKEAEFVPAQYEGKSVPAEKMVWIQFRR